MLPTALLRQQITKHFVPHQAGPNYEADNVIFTVCGKFSLLNRFEIWLHDFGFFFLSKTILQKFARKEKTTQNNHKKLNISEKSENGDREQ